MKSLILSIAFAFITFGVYPMAYATETVPETPTEAKTELTNPVKIQNALTDLLVSMSTGLQDGSTIIKDGVSSSVDFAKREIPLVLKEIIIYGIISNSIWTVIYIVLSILTIVGMYCYIKKIPWKNYDENGVFLGILGGFIMTFFFFGFLLCSIDHGEKVIKASVTPRLYLIDYAVDMSKKLR